MKGNFRENFVQNALTIFEIFWPGAQNILRKSVLKFFAFETYLENNNKRN